MISLEGKRAVVTGAASGIGLAISRLFLELGASVVGIDENREALDHVRQDLARGSRWLPLDVDISSIDQCTSAFMRGGFKETDVLVNNAGIDLPIDPSCFDGAASEDVDSVFATNIRGTLEITCSILKCMVRRQRGGAIIFITSVHTRQAFRDGLAYDASKHALVGMMRVLAVRYARQGIRVNAIAPGAIYPTGITAGLTPADRDRMGARIPMGRLGLPREVANTCAFLASDAASYITGVELLVDGGLAIQTPLEVS